MAKLTAPIPREKIGESFVWREWFQRLSDKVFGTMAAQDATSVDISGGVINNIDFSSGDYTWPTFNQDTTGTAGSVAHSVTFNNSGTGAASGTDFDGSATRTISYNTIGAQGSFGVQNANYVYAGPTSGAAAIPTFRALTAADVPSLSGTYLPLAGGTMLGTINLPASTTTLIPLHFAQGTMPSPTTDGDMWFDNNGMYIQNLSAIHQLDADANAVGALSSTTITDNGNGTINASAIEVFIYAASGWQGNYMRRTVPAAGPFTLTDQSQNFLYVTYNGGSPIFQITASATTVNSSNNILCATMWRDGTDIHHESVNWGLATATRLNDRLINIQRYTRSSGLVLGETSTPANNTITCTAGLVWYGIKAFSEAVQSSASSNVDFYYHSGGNWAHSTVSTYNVTQYDDGTNLQTLANSHYTVNWVYRFINGDALPKLAYHLGSNDYPTVAAAAGASEPAPPPVLTQMAILIGRIIVAKNGTTASQIDSAFSTVFAGTAITDHNNLAGLQGGASASYYHLTGSKYSQITAAPVTKTADFTLADTETWVINNKSGSTCTVTLPAASSWSGRVVHLQNYQAHTLVSASSNVVPLVGGSAGTAILAAVAGDTCTLVSDGSNWLMTQYVPNNVLLLE